MLLKNGDKREHAKFECGHSYFIPKGKTADIPDRIAVKMMRRYPKLVKVDSIEDEVAGLENELEVAENAQEIEGAEGDETEA